VLPSELKYASCHAFAGRFHIFPPYIIFPDTCTLHVLPSCSQGLSDICKAVLGHCLVLHGLLPTLWVEQCEHLAQGPRGHELLACVTVTLHKAGQHLRSSSSLQSTSAVREGVYPEAMVAYTWLILM
jgi:hypothetical protein